MHFEQFARMLKCYRGRLTRKCSSDRAEQVGMRKGRTRRGGKVSTKRRDHVAILSTTACYFELCRAVPKYSAFSHPNVQVSQFDTRRYTSINTRKSSIRHFKLLIDTMGVVSTETNEISRLLSRTIPRNHETHGKRGPDNEQGFTTASLVLVERNGRPRKNQ